jgi:hypothetical protein
VVGEEPCVSEIRFAARLDDVDRGTPFFDSDQWAQHVREFGFPVCHKRRLFVPANYWWAWSGIDNVPLWQFISIVISYELGIPEPLHPHLLAEAAPRLHSTP